MKQNKEKLDQMVEAVMRIKYPNGRPDFTYWDGRNYDERKEKITEALASLESSEREVLSGEQFYEKFREVRNELSAVTGTYSLSEAIIKTFDLYLAEKQSKTEEK